MNESKDLVQTSQENNTNKSNSEYQRNIEVLKRESASLSKIYEIAVEYDPRLSDTKIIASTLNKPFFARKPWKTESGKGEIHVLFGDNNEIGQIAVNSITEDPDFEQQFRSWTYSNPDQEISPQLARAYIFLHELGHVADYYNHNNDQKAYDTKMQILKNNLPLGYLSASDIAQRYDSGDVEFQQKVISNYGNLKNALTKYRNVKHNLSFEKKADEFAHKVLQRNATTLIALANNLYKN